MMDASELLAPECHVRLLETIFIIMVCMLDDLRRQLTGSVIVLLSQAAFTLDKESVLFSEERLKC